MGEQERKEEKKSKSGKKEKKSKKEKKEKKQVEIAEPQEAGAPAMDQKQMMAMMKKMMAAQAPQAGEVTLDIRALPRRSNGFPLKTPVPMVNNQAPALFLPAMSPEPVAVPAVRSADVQMAPSKAVGVPPYAAHTWSTAAYRSHGHVQTIPQKDSPVEMVATGCNTVMTNISNMVERVIEVVPSGARRDSYVPPMTLPRPGTCHVEINTSITNDNKGAGRVIDIAAIRGMNASAVRAAPKLTMALTSVVDILPARAFAAEQPAVRVSYPSMRSTPSCQMPLYNVAPAENPVMSMSPMSIPVSPEDIPVDYKGRSDVWDRMDNYIAWLHTTGAAMDATPVRTNSTDMSVKHSVCSRYGNRTRLSQE